MLGCKLCCSSLRTLCSRRWLIAVAMIVGWSIRWGWVTMNVGFINQQWTNYRRFIGFMNMLHNSRSLTRNTLLDSCSGNNHSFLPIYHHIRPHNILASPHTYCMDMSLRTIRCVGRTTLLEDMMLHSTHGSKNIQKYKWYMWIDFSTINTVVRSSYTALSWKYMYVWDNSRSIGFGTCMSWCTCYSK